MSKDTFNKREKYYKHSLNTIQIEDAQSIESNKMQLDESDPNSGIFSISSRNRKESEFLRVQEDEHSLHINKVNIDKCNRNLDQNEFQRVNFSLESAQGLISANKNIDIRTQNEKILNPKSNTDISPHMQEPKSDSAEFKYRSDLLNHYYLQKKQKINDTNSVNTFDESINDSKKTNSIENSFISPPLFKQDPYLPQPRINNPESKPNSSNFNKRFREKSLETSHKELKSASEFNCRCKGKFSSNIENFIKSLEIYLKNSSNFNLPKDLGTDLNLRIENIQRFIEGFGKIDVKSLDKSKEIIKTSEKIQNLMEDKNNFRQIGNKANSFIGEDDEIICLNEDLKAEIGYLKDEYDKLQEKLMDASEFVEELEIECEELRNERLVLKSYCFIVEKENEEIRSKILELQQG